MKRPEAAYTPEHGPQERGLRPIDAILTYTALLLIAYGWLSYQGGDVQDWFPVSSRRPLWAALTGVAVGLLVVGASHLASAWSARYRALEDLIGSLVGDQSAAGVFLLAAFSSLGEECFFRGALQPQLGLVVTSALFGALHGLPGTRLGVWGAFAFLAGLCFGGLSEEFQSLWAPTAAHFVINFINLHLLIRKQRAQGTTQKTKETFPESNEPARVGELDERA